MKMAKKSTMKSRKAMKVYMIGKGKRQKKRKKGKSARRNLENSRFGRRGWVCLLSQGGGELPKGRVGGGGGFMPFVNTCFARTLQRRTEDARKKDKEKREEGYKQVDTGRNSTKDGGNGR